MSWNQTELTSSNHTNTSANYSYVDIVQKPIEIFVFIDPLCAECWSLEPYLKKLSVEYGRFFTIRQIVSGQLRALNTDSFDKPRKLKDMWERTAKRTGMSCDGDLWIENPVSYPWIASLAIKAAELQGKKAGMVFLRKLQENLFLKKQNISDGDVLLQCAKEAKLDVEEFERDLFSGSAKKAYQCDLKLTREMEVDYIPTIVFFNQVVEEEGIKISGLYPYEIYELVLKEMLQRTPIPSVKPPLETFLEYYEVVGTKEISVVYDWSLAKTEKEMKKLQFQQVVEKIPAKYGSFWKYIF
ncbi:ClpXP adapter SpxH family protein [Oceanobacillus profundus]|uniref:ClpXP adapter protein SpxH n=1 Tax=Oceanobacillus profundus TaxID=372463 RepID=A0A417YLS2_9BACI|nr:ClpXP adapter SpxH family protein [Oceanobacillus profundus]MBR3120682.1 DsbA family protein [Oceanobacillus sp.]MDO6449240.1 ClpXP adapter SpxH family protein [Oceanobacillus profundus]PAE29643.1 dithiol-disulfide isomerase [Paenibacillus sp. 7884-2]RHW34447.1 DsbA family protein [Oceanobacillus profundus]